MNWKNELRTMKLRAIEISHPAFFELSGGYRMKTKPYHDRTANGLTNAIMEWINLRGGYANRINVQGQPRVEHIPMIGGRTVQKVSFTPSMTNKGTADVHAFYKGLHLSIEIKIGRDRVSPAQERERRRIEGAGGIYFVARSMGGVRGMV